MPLGSVDRSQRLEESSLVGGHRPPCRVPHARPPDGRAGRHFIRKRQRSRRQRWVSSRGRYRRLYIASSPGPPLRRYWQPRRRQLFLLQPISECRWRSVSIESKWPRCLVPCPCRGAARQSPTDVRPDRRDRPSARHLTLTVCGYTSEIAYMEASTGIMSTSLQE